MHGWILRLFPRKLDSSHRVTKDMFAFLRSFQDVDIALFSAGGSISKKFGPLASAAGCTVSSLQHVKLNLLKLTVFDKHLYISCFEDPC